MDFIKKLSKATCRQPVPVRFVFTRDSAGFAQACGDSVPMSAWNEGLFAIKLHGTSSVLCMDMDDANKTKVRIWVPVEFLTLKEG
jgi:hypothetical protein